MNPFWRVCERMSQRPGEDHAEAAGVTVIGHRNRSGGTGSSCGSRFDRFGAGVGVGFRFVTSSFFDSFFFDSFFLLDALSTRAPPETITRR